MPNLADQVRQELTEAIESDQLVLPSLPEVAMAIRTEASDPNASAARLARVIGRDVALSARIIRVANSPLMRGNRTITDLQMAISRLGIQYTSNLATGLAMQQMYQSDSPLIDAALRSVWQSSTEIAGIAHIVCKHYTRLAADQATLAGLLHQVGALPILAFAETRPDLRSSAQTLQSLLDALHPEMGHILLDAWDFPEEISAVPAHYRDFTRDSERVDYVDIVTVAVLESLIGSDHPYTQLDWSAIPAFAKVGLDPEVEMQEATDVSEEMEAAMAIFK
ncbi:MAG: HDOD domain-containing protein [Pseudomonadota bacterium]|nr:HDOD domain-containing protein [Pseudomonadota bacterium]